METLVTDTHFYINMVFDHLLPSVQLRSFMEWTCTSHEQSVAEYYTILFVVRFQVALKLLEVGIYLTVVSKTDQSYSVILKSGDCAGQRSC
jgi:hypothetical protein